MISLLAAAVSWTMQSFAQDEIAGTTTVLRDRLQSSDRLIRRLLENPDQAPEELREDLVALRESMQGIRDAWIGEYRPGDGATTEEIRSARKAFQEKYADQLSANKELRKAVMQELRESVRDVIDELEWSEEARALYADYKGIQTELADAWLAIKSELDEDASRVEIAEAKELFKEANSGLIATQKELAIQVRELIRENRQDATGLRDSLPQELQVLRGEMAGLREQMEARKRLAREDMRDLTKEEREQYRQKLLSELREIQDGIRNRRRQVIDEFRDSQNGDHGPGN